MYYMIEGSNASETTVPNITLKSPMPTHISRGGVITPETNYKRINLSWQ
jgi:hypothetical protein